jgi:hypothetical protein
MFLLFILNIYYHNNTNLNSAKIMINNIKLIGVDMSRRSQIMMSNTTGKFEETGPAVRADSYYGFTDGLHTIAVHYNNLTGRVKIQGTLSMEPSESDWFDINLQGYECNSETYVEYPKDPARPTTSGTGGFIGDSGVDAFTFIGNFTFLRAKLERSYLGEIDINHINLGVVDKILLSL